MQITEFVEETARIEKYFGKELEKFQREIWYNEFRNTSLARYRQIIIQVFRECKFMPKLADLVDIEKELPYTKTENIQSEKVECQKCDSLGYILYKKIVDNGINKLEYEFVARCDCENGLENAYDGTTISDIKNRSKYYIPTAQQIGL